MPKLTKDYESLQNIVIDALDNDAHKLRAFFQPRRDERLQFEKKLVTDYFNLTGDNIEPYRRFWRKSVAARQFYGAIQPLADMYKDFNLIAPYKTDTHGLRDFLPVRIVWGAVNMLKGSLILAMIAPVLAVSVIFDLRLLAKGPVTYLKQVGRSLGYASSWVLDGVSHLVRGSTEIAFSPLAFFRMLFRAGQSSVMIQNPGFAQVMQEARQAACLMDRNAATIPAPLFVTLYELQRKTQKAMDRGQYLSFQNRSYFPENNFEALKTKTSAKQRVDNYLNILR